MTDRDRRYNASAKGRRRNKRYAQTAKRLAYMRRWQRARRKRQKLLDSGKASA